MAEAVALKVVKVVGSIALKFGLGFISDIIRDYGAKKLQDGGLTNQMFRDCIVRELDDAKFKLDALSRKDLLASITSLKKGILRLQTCFECENPSTSMDQKELKNTASGGTTSSQTKPAQQSAVSVEDAVTLANAIKKLKIESKERFESAKESFKKAGEEANGPFHNAALSIKERILATKVRIASAILENLDDPHLATTDCLLYLEELHTLPAIKDIFSVHVEGGIKSIFKEDLRAEIVETVTKINLMLADFITKFTKRRMGILDWPMIECSKRVVHPIHYQKKSVGKLEEMKITPPWDIVTCDSCTYRTVINSKSDVIRVNPSYVNTENRLQKYDRATGEWKSFCSFPPNFLCGFQKPLLITIDDNDNMYFVGRNSHFPWKYMFSVYSSNGKHTHSCPLDFIDGYLNGMTVTKEKIVFWSIGYTRSSSSSVSVYVCDISGKLIKSLPNLVESATGGTLYVSLDKSADNDITVVAPSLSSRTIALFVFTKEGQLKRTVNLHSRYYWRMSYAATFDHVTKNYVFARRECSAEPISLEWFSETGKLRNALFVDGTFDEYKEVFYTNTNDAEYQVVSYTNGAMAIVGKNQICHLRLQGI